MGANVLGHMPVVIIIRSYVRKIFPLRTSPLSMREEKTEPTEVFSGEILDEGLKRTKKVLKKIEYG